MGIKVLDIHNHSTTNRLFSKDVVKLEKEQKDSFALKLKQLKGDSVIEKLNNLLADIDEQSKKLTTKLYLSDLLKYKKLVKDFLNIAVRNSHQFSKEGFLDRRGRHKIMSAVKLVNKELDILTQQFLRDEKDRVKILQKLDDIRGILIDIFM